MILHSFQPTGFEPVVESGPVYPRSSMFPLNRIGETWSKTIKWSNTVQNGQTIGQPKAKFLDNQHPLVKDGPTDDPQNEINQNLL